MPPLLFFFAILLASLAPALAVSPQYKSIIERDPFDPGRGEGKTAIEGGAVSSEASELEEKYSVYGIILAGKNKSAFIKPINGNKRAKKAELRKINVGDLIDGWTVKDITDKGVILVSGDDHVLLKVFTSKKERQSNRPVGIATPRPAPTRPAIRPMDQQKLKEAIERAKHPKIKPSNMMLRKPNEKPFVNPFLKAIQKQKELGKRPD